MASLSILFVLSSTGRRIRWINLQIHPVLHLSSRHWEQCCDNQNLDCYSICRKSGARELSFCSILSTRRPRDRSFSRHVTKIGTDVLVLIFRNAKNFNWFDSFFPMTTRPRQQISALRFILASRSPSSARQHASTTSFTSDSAIAPFVCFKRLQVILSLALWFGFLFSW